MKAAERRRRQRRRAEERARRASESTAEEGGESAPARAAASRTAGTGGGAANPIAVGEPEREDPIAKMTREYAEAKRRVFGPAVGEPEHEGLIVEMTRAYAEADGLVNEAADIPAATLSPMAVSHLASPSLPSSFLRGREP